MRGYTRRWLQLTTGHLGLLCISQRRLLDQDYILAVVKGRDIRPLLGWRGGGAGSFSLRMPGLKSRQKALVFSWEAALGERED